MNFREELMTKTALVEEIVYSFLPAEEDQQKNIM